MKNKELEVWFGKHERMIWAIVHDFSDKPEEFDDLFQEACIGVIMGYPKYDKTKSNAKLSSYLYSCATNQLRMKYRFDKAKSRDPGEYITTFEEIAFNKQMRWWPQFETGRPPFKWEMPVVEYEQISSGDRDVEDNYMAHEMLELVHREVTKVYGSDAFDILVKLAAGYSQDCVAADLGISQATLSSKVKNIRNFIATFDWDSAKSMIKKHKPAPMVTVEKKEEIKEELPVKPKQMPKVKKKTPKKAEKKGTTIMKNSEPLNPDPQKLAIADNVFCLLGYSRKNHKDLIQYRNTKTKADIFISKDSAYKMEGKEIVGMSFEEIKAVDTALSVMHL